jgi:hypothetical protein
MTSRPGVMARHGMDSRRRLRKGSVERLVVEDDGATTMVGDELDTLEEMRSWIRMPK